MQSAKIIASILIISGLFLISCNDFLGPDDDNHSGTARLYTDPAFAEGLLLNGYVGWLNNYALDEVATDDAVTNVKGSSYQRMATGEWSALYNPISVWNSAYTRLYYINYFLSIMDKVDWAWDDRASRSSLRDSLFKQRFTGEAKILRAWYNFELLKNHGGLATDNTPQGFIILRDVPDRTQNYNLPRNSYDECVQFILEDINEGIRLLPNVYADKPASAPDYVAYNLVFGSTNRKNNNRIDGRFGKALKSRVTLYTASMPFYTAPGKWDSAAVAAGRLLTTAGGGINGVGAMSNNIINFWRYDADAEILFRRDYANLNTREVANFPPSRYGNGQTNPSQNLVDAFPMANGYPIDSAASGYNATTPYVGRDPRLAAYIVFDGGNINNVVVHTNVEDPKDGLNQLVTSTRTGYYMKKLLQPAVNLTPSVMSLARHFYTLFRYTEIFLNYAEAANEAWGPDEDPQGYGFTPRLIIAALRKKGGITGTDPYLTGLVGKDAMREMIRNERRIMLCFEGFRFWDMRRWGLTLDDEVKGMKIEGGIYTVIPVEERKYQPHMKYGPIPYQETLKSNLTLQNAGW